MEPYPPSYRFRRPDEQVSKEYRHLTPLKNEQSAETGCMQYELMLNAFMLGGFIGGPLTLLFGPNLSNFILGTIFGAILAMIILWGPTNRMLERAANDPEELERLRKRLNSIDDFG